MVGVVIVLLPEQTIPALSEACMTLPKLPNALTNTVVPDAKNPPANVKNPDVDVIT